MCTTCGCAEGETRIDGAAPGPVHRHDDGTVHSHADGHHHHPAHHRDHSHPPDRGHDHVNLPARPHLGSLHFGLGAAAAHAPGLSQAKMVRIERDVLAKNNAFAARNRRLLADRGVFAVNLVSSPGSGKTTLLVRTIAALARRLPVAVIEGDQQTSHDAERIRATGVPAIQINTGKGCHLDAQMVSRALDALALADGSLLLIENVGNLVCPAEFDLGEAHKVVILSVTEGEDKPLKYPNMFRAAELMVLAKTDLLPHLDFDVGKCVEYAQRVHPGIETLQVSSTTGEGLAEWLGWLERGAAGAREAQAATIAALRARVAELEARLGATGA